MPVVDGDDGAARTPNTRTSPLYIMEARTTTWVQLCMQQVLCDLEIVHRCCTILRLPCSSQIQRMYVRHNLEIVQNPRLRGTKILEDEWSIIVKARKFTVFEILREFFALS